MRSVHVRRSASRVNNFVYSGFLDNSHTHKKKSILSSLNDIQGYILCVWVSANKKHPTRGFCDVFQTNIFLINWFSNNCKNMRDHISFTREIKYLKYHYCMCVLPWYFFFFFFESKLILYILILSCSIGDYC